MKRYHIALGLLALGIALFLAKCQAPKQTGETACMTVNLSDPGDTAWVITAAAEGHRVQAFDKWGERLTTEALTDETTIIVCLD